MNITLADKTDIRDCAEIARKYKLYEHEEWCLYNTLCSISRIISDDFLSRFSLALLWDDDMPVGVCLYSLKDFCSVSTYIKPEYRRQGYGTTLFCAMYKSLTPYRRKKVRLHTGTAESFFYFESLINKNMLKENQIIDKDFSGKISILKNAVKAEKSDKSMDMPFWLRSYDLADIRL